MPVTATPVMEREGAARTSRDTPIVSSYKCEDCGKIIAAPGANPTPKCCGAEMRKIR
jgi:ABC-type ATPase with predicted acetyltransferase domain